MSKKSQLLELIMNCFCGMINQQKAFFYFFFLKAYFHPGPLSEILTAASIRYFMSRI